MNCSTIFKKMQDIIPIKIMEKMVKESGAEVYTKKYTVLRQLNTLIYAEITEKSGLEAIEAGIKGEEKIQEYTGIISGSQISRVNRDRPPELFKAVFDELYKELNEQGELRKIPLNYGVLKVLDSTAVQLCLKLYPWAKYRDNKGAVKVHTLYDVTSECPESIVMTEGIVADKSKMSDFIKQPGVTYIFDRAYLDYAEFDKYCDNGIYFVSRLKKNAVFKIVKFNPVKAGSNVLSDITVILGSHSARMNNPVRLVRVVDSSNGEHFYIVTNRFDLTPEEISDMYRLRWSIEVFFKWIKQHLKIKHFYGTSFNAVLTQIYSALIVYCLLRIIHIRYFSKFDFLKTVRLISSGLFNTIDYIISCLTPSRPPPIHKRNHLFFNWRTAYSEILSDYELFDFFV